MLKKNVVMKIRKNIFFFFKFILVSCFVIKSSSLLICSVPMPVLSTLLNHEAIYMHRLLKKKTSLIRTLLAPGACLHVSHLLFGICLFQPFLC